LTVAGLDEARLRQQVEELRDAGVRYVCASMVDSGSINRVKCFALDKLEQFVRSGSGFSTSWALALSNDQVIRIPDLGGPVGDMCMVPDPDSLVALAATPEWAWVAMDFYTQDSESLPTCTRQFVKRMVRAAAERGYSLGMAYELEWLMASVRGDGGLEPIHNGPGYSANAWAKVSDFAVELLDTLAAQGIAVSQFHPEYSPGQMEVSLGVADPLTMADRHVLFRHTVRSISEKHGCRASFSPVTVPGLGNGCHLHFSLWDEVGHRNLFSGGERALELTAEGEAFLAGVLAELPAIIALGCPTVPSYARLQPQRWAGAYQCWGHENREAALRFIQGMVGNREQTANMELKAIDCAGHPYLVPGAIIAAGLNGLDEGMKLPPSCPVDPSTMSSEDLAAAGIRRLPCALSIAADALEASTVMRTALGPTLHSCMVAVRRAEAQTDECRPLEEVVLEHLWRF
jgi:glutamine synthetase